MFGCKIKVQFADGALSASPGTASDGGSPSNGGGSSMPRKPRRDRTVNSSHACSASKSNDSGVKLSSSDDSEGVGEDGGLAARAPAVPEQQPFDEDAQLDSTASSVPLNGDDIVVCGPVEEIDVDMETPTKDVNTHNTEPTSAICEPVTTPSKKTKKKKSQCASKPCKLALAFVIFLFYFLHTVL